MTNEDTTHSNDSNPQKRRSIGNDVLKEIEQDNEVNMMKYSSMYEQNVIGEELCKSNK